MGTTLYGPPTFNQPVRFNSPITLVSDGTVNPCLTIVGKTGDPLKQLFEIFDGVGTFPGNPIQGTANAGGDAVYGDRRSAFRGGDVFNPDFQTLTAVADNVAANAAAIKLGHGTSQTAIFAIGSGAASATNPLTSGPPAAGGMYFNKDGAAGARLYVSIAGAAWVAIAGI